MRLFEFLAAYFRTGGGRVVERNAGGRVTPIDHGDEVPVVVSRGGPLAPEVVPLDQLLDGTPPQRFVRGDRVQTVDGSRATVTGPAPRGPRGEPAVNLDWDGDAGGPAYERDLLPADDVARARDELDRHYQDVIDLFDAERAEAATDVRPLVLAPPIAPAPPAETGVNVDLLRRVLEHITKDPGNWDQSVWWKDNECGTTGCLAGWAVRLQYPDAVMPHAEPSVAGAPPRHVQEIARDELGLKPVEAIRLFNGGNDLRDLWTLAAEFTNGAIVPPAELPDGS